MDAGAIGKVVVLYNADVAAESAARYAAQQSLGAASEASMSLVRVAESAPDNGPTIRAVAARLDKALERFTLVVEDKFSANGDRKLPFNEGIANATTGLSLLRTLHPNDIALSQAAKGISSIGTATTGTFGATPGRAAQARAHVQGALADIHSGRLG